MVAVVAVVAVVASAVPSPPIEAARRKLPFEQEIRAFAQADRATHPMREGLLFDGSSSFRQWTNVSARMAPLPVLYCAFGGWF